MKRLLPVAVAIHGGCAGPDGGLADGTPVAGSAGRAEPVYRIDGKPVQLDNAGEDGTVSLLRTVSGDLNDDGRLDRGVLLVLNSRGSGVFYYLNAFLSDGDASWSFAGDAFLGDRIKFDFMDIYGKGSVSTLTGVPVHPDDHGQLVVAFFIHGAEQAFAEEPERYLTRHWKVTDGVLVAVEDY